VYYVWYNYHTRVSFLCMQLRVGEKAPDFELFIVKPKRHAQEILTYVIELHRL